MKNKIYTLSALLILSLFFSCSSDDDGVQISQASRDLRGTWELFQIIENNTPVAEIPCSQQREFTFKQDFTYEEVNFALQNSGNCGIAATFNGNWENIEDDMVLTLKRIRSESSENLTISFRNNARFFDVNVSSNRTITYEKIN